MSSRNQSVGWIWECAVHSSRVEGDGSISAALSAREFQCLWFLSDSPGCILVFPLSLDLFLLVNHNRVVFVLFYRIFMHLPHKRIYLHFFNEIEAEFSLKHSSYWLKINFFKDIKFVSYHPSLKISQYFGFIDLVKNVNQPLQRVSKELALRSDPELTIKTSALKKYW